MIRIPVADSFVEFNVTIVDAPLPILLGEDIMDTLGIEVRRMPPHLYFHLSNTRIPLTKLQSGHLALTSDPATHSTLLYTTEKLMNLHKRFGHASVDNFVMILTGIPL